MDYHIEEEYTVCSNVLIPYLKTYCSTGFYVSVPFTAKKYFVVVKSPQKPVFVTYKVFFNKGIHFEVPTDGELEDVKYTLHRATECFENGGGECEEMVREMSAEETTKQNEEENEESVCLSDVFRGYPVKINDVQKIEQDIVYQLNRAVKEVRGSRITLDDVPEDIRPYIALGHRPNVVVFPVTETKKIEELPILNEFALYRIRCGSFIPQREKQLRIPVAYPFVTKLYEIVASAEVTNRCSNETLKNHIKCFLAYKVSRAVAYH